MVLKIVLKIMNNNVYFNQTKHFRTIYIKILLFWLAFSYHADGDFTEEKRKISIYNDTQLELPT